MGGTQRHQQLHGLRINRPSTAGVLLPAGRSVGRQAGPGHHGQLAAGGIAGAAEAYRAGLVTWPDEEDHGSDEGEPFERYPAIIARARREHPGLDDRRRHQLPTDGSTASATGAPTATAAGGSAFRT